jgi:peptidoglycan/LPS O-acetylase OafA/YrhL
MIEALINSTPKPTWYSSVPTIHNATVAFLHDNAHKYQVNSGVWKGAHSLRMIRSGAAALMGPDGDALSKMYGDIPILPTYSMTEQMPISQPPKGMGNQLQLKPGSVGVPVAASCAIVSRTTLRPQPPGMEGEIAISGPTVLKRYLANPEADKKSYFYMTTPGTEDWEYWRMRQNRIGEHDQGDGGDGRWFLTGDVGVLDSEGFLSLKGRSRELIKKGGEQVSPYEVEELLTKHPWVRTAVCFSVPSKLYGEEVGCAVVLSPEVIVAQQVHLRELISALRALLANEKLALAKFPTKWTIVKDEELPKTSTKKYIRIGLSEVLGIDGGIGAPAAVALSTPKMNWAVLSGLRFYLSLMVMFMHIGSDVSWGAVSNLRQFPWHVHLFFALGGFGMAAPMAPAIKKPLGYFTARVCAMYPLYLLCLIFAIGNLLVTCRPSTFSPSFHWDSQINDLYICDSNGTQTEQLQPLFCEGTPAFPDTWAVNFILTIAVHVLGLQATPLWTASWFLGYYLWFSSMYYQCLAIFPTLYNVFYRHRRRKVWLACVLAALLLLNMAILLGFWFLVKDTPGYNHFDSETGKPTANAPTAFDSGGRDAAQFNNAVVLTYYLFSPFWILYFIAGVCTAFLYDALRPAEQHSSWMWGVVADVITLIIIVVSIAHIAQGYKHHSAAGVSTFDFPLRPSEGDSFSDSRSVARIWDNIYARLFAPLTLLWVFAMCTGRGITAYIASNKFLVETLSPTSYSCFLFHQMVGQWYFAATRSGHWWNWWRYRKTQFWFSPNPCPVEWYEYFYVTILVVAWSKGMGQVEPYLIDISNAIRDHAKAKDAEMETVDVVLRVIESMTGIEAKADWLLEECGLASIGVPVLAGLLNKRFSRQQDIAVQISVVQLISANTIADIAAVVDKAKEVAKHNGV